MGGGVQAGLEIWVAVLQEVSEELLTADVLSPEEALLPCSLNAAMAGASGGALGAVFGFGAEALSLLHMLCLSGRPMRQRQSRGQSLEGTCSHLLSQEAACAGGKAVRHSGPGRWRAARTEALTSAKVRVVLTLEKQLSSDTSLQIRCCVCRALQPSAAYLRWPAAS